MRSNKAKCRSIADGLPGGLKVESFIDGPRESCKLDVGVPSDHVTDIQNRTLLRFKISISTETESEHLQYQDGAKNWKADVEIGHRPSTGGYGQRLVKTRLTGSDPADDNGINMTITYSAIGFLCEGTSSVQLLVDTRKNSSGQS